LDFSDLELKHVEISRVEMNFPGQKLLMITRQRAPGSYFQFALEDRPKIGRRAPKAKDLAFQMS